MSEIRSGAAVFRTQADSRISDWNAECERITGIAAEEAEDRYCWEVIGGRSADGGIVCHPGCSVARLARQGWPVRCADLHMRTPLGPKLVTISTITLRDGDETRSSTPCARQQSKSPRRSRRCASPA